MSHAVWVRYESSPVRVLSGNGVEHKLELCLWNGIKAIEFFPETENGNKYTLTLSKSVTEVSHISPVQTSLEQGLKQLSLVWPFSGGSHMDLQKQSTQNVPLYSTNAQEIHKELSARMGQARLVHSLNLQYAVTGTYHNFPLKRATVLTQAMRSDMYLRLMLEYMSESRTDEKAWFIHLYKIRDTLNYAAKKQRPPMIHFGIGKQKWRRFGSILNREYDLRHAPNPEKPVKTLNSTDKDFVRKVATEMIYKYLAHHKI